MTSTEEDTKSIKTSDDKSAKKPHKINKHDFNMISCLGDGAFGKVMKSQCIYEGTPAYNKFFAIKVMDKRHIMKNNKHKYVALERDVFIKCKTHPLICHLHFTFQDTYSLFYVLDLCENNDLAYLIYKYVTLPEYLIKFYLSEVVSVIEFLHKNNIFHRDIKPDNILIHGDNHIRVTDFGTAKIISPNKEENETNKSEENNKNPRQNRKGSFVGTPLYVPPEFLAGNPKWDGMDFWALGIIIYECLTGKTPFAGETEYLTFKKIENFEMNPIPKNISVEIKDLMLRLLEFKVDDRLGMKGIDEIKNHSFFKDINWDPKALANRDIPLFPSTPKNSPIHLEENESRDRIDSDILALSSNNKKQINNSNNNVINNEIKENVEPIDDISNINSRSSSNIDMNSKLYEKWKSILNKDEIIIIGSQVEISKYFGMSSDSYVMLLTNNKRILLIDHLKMSIKKEILTVTIITTNIKSKDTFEIVTTGKTFKCKVIGSNSKLWEQAIKNS